MDEKITQTEINIRGKALTISVTIEVAMVRIILFSNGQQYDPTSEERLNLKYFTFPKKLELMETKLQQYHSDLLTKYSKLLDDIKEFKNLRNRMAHCSFTWDDNGKDFKIWDASDDYSYYVSIPTTVKETYKQMEDYIDLTVPIFSLQHEVEARLELSHPHIYHQLTKG